jgi:ligand-binding sensor domain-containing protein
LFVNGTLTPLSLPGVNNVLDESHDEVVHDLWIGSVEGLRYFEKRRTINLVEHPLDPSASQIQNPTSTKSFYSDPK